MPRPGERARGKRGEGRSEQGTKIKLKIPAGIEDGSRLRSTGNGEAGVRGGQNGDLYDQTRSGGGAMRGSSCGIDSMFAIVVVPQRRASSKPAVIDAR